MSAPLLLMDRPRQLQLDWKRAWHYGLIPSVIAPLHNSIGRRRNIALKSSVIQIDRVKANYREEWGERVLFMQACHNFEKQHGHRADNDYRKEMTVGIDVGRGDEAIIVYKGEVIRGTVTNLVICRRSA